MVPDTVETPAMVGAEREMVVARTRRSEPIGEVLLWWTAMGHRSAAAAMAKVAMPRTDGEAAVAAAVAVGTPESPRAGPQDAAVPETPRRATQSTTPPPQAHHWTWSSQHYRCHWHW